FRKRDPRPAADLTDLELLTVILGQRQQAAAVLQAVGGKLAGIAALDSAAALLTLPGVDRATAARVECLWEAAARLAEQA
ncbi:MAG TPA: hypothetical protein VHN99_08375, partial [Deinococcales bacterium]|nr:hypothetical protein [Deinococcales bacterium]